MERHLFDGVGRVPMKALETVPVRRWSPPVINGAGHLVQAQSRDEGGRRDGLDGNRSADRPREERVDEGYLEGLEKGRAEGVVEGRKSGFEQGQADGLAQGLQQGLKNGEKQINARLLQLDGLMTHLTHALNEQDYKLEQALLNLVQSIATAVIRRELEINSSHILQVVREALAALPPSRDNVRIFVNPADQLLLEEARALTGDNWRALPDEGVMRGGCRIETDQSLADFTTETRFNSMIEQILGKQLLLPADECEPEEFEVAPEPLVPRMQLEAETPEEVPEEPHEPGLLEQVENLRAGMIPAIPHEHMPHEDRAPEELAGT